METNLGGFGSSRRENNTQFWVMTNRLFRNQELIPKRPHVAVGTTRHPMILFAPLDVLRDAFRKDQKAEHLQIYDDEGEGEVEVLE